MRRLDPVLGPVKVCLSCEEEWPEDAEFFYRKGRRFTARCKDCWKARYRRRSITTRAPVMRCDPPECVRNVGHAGECRSRWRSTPRCGAPMPLADDICHRTLGHGDHHSSEYAMSHRRVPAVAA